MSLEMSQEQRIGLKSSKFKKMSKTMTFNNNYAKILKKSNHPCHDGGRQGENSSKI